MKVNRDNNQEYKHRVDYDYKVRDKVILTNHTEYKSETPYTGPCLISQCFTKGTVMLQYGAMTI